MSPRFRTAPGLACLNAAAYWLARAASRGLLPSPYAESPLLTAAAFLGVWAAVRAWHARVPFALACPQASAGGAAVALALASWWPLLRDASVPAVAPQAGAGRLLPALVSTAAILAGAWCGARAPRRDWTPALILLSVFLPGLPYLVWVLVRPFFLG